MNRKLSEGCERFLSGGQCPCPGIPKPVRGGDQTRGCSRPTSAHLIEDADEGQSIVVLQRYSSIHTLLRRQHLGEGFCELAGSYVNVPELREECIPGRWNI